MNSLRIFSLASVLLVLIASCKESSLERKKSNDPSPAVNADSTLNPEDTVSNYNPGALYTASSHNTGTDIYVAGSINSNSKSYAGYWKNDQFVQLPLPSGITQFMNSTAWAVKLSQGDVYVAGNIMTSLKTYAVYWKNDVPVIVDDGGHDNNLAFALAVSGDDVYLAGTSGGLAVYWKNGVINQLSGDIATCIYISDNDVYVGGRSEGTAVYWKNGTMTKLVEGNYVSGIGVVGDDVHVTGMFQASFPQAIYWKNGVATNLSTRSNTSALAIDGNDVYVLGRDIDDSYYWKNGEQVSFVKDRQHLPYDVSSLAVLDGIVYVAGSTGYATYWKDGLATTLEPGFAAYGIAVRK